MQTLSKSDRHAQTHPKKYPDLVKVNLHERIAPTMARTGGYDGRPGSQSSTRQNPSSSANAKTAPTRKPGQ